MDTTGGGERGQESGKGGSKPLTPRTKGPKGLDWWAPPAGEKSELAQHQVRPARTPVRREAGRARWAERPLRNTEAGPFPTSLG